MLANSQFDGKRVILLLYEYLYISTQHTIKLVSSSIRFQETGPQPTIKI